MLTLLIKKQGGRKPPCLVVGMTGQLSNLLSQAAPDEAHQNKKPTLAKAMVGEVGATGQLSNLFSQAAPDEAHQNKKPTNAKAMVGEVGTTGFEPATPCTPCKCATGLRYVPRNLDTEGCKSKEKTLSCRFIHPYNINEKNNT